MIKESDAGRPGPRPHDDGLPYMYSKKEIKQGRGHQGHEGPRASDQTEDTPLPGLLRADRAYAFGEVSVAPTGVVNVADERHHVYEQNKHYEVAPVLNITQHEANNNCIWVSDKAWNSFSAERRSWVQNPLELRRLRARMALVGGFCRQLQRSALKLFQALSLTQMQLLLASCW